MKGKYRLYCFIAFIAFIVISISSIFIVFRKYHTENEDSQHMTKTKLRYSKVKEKIAELESIVSVDSSYCTYFQNINLEKSYLDSILNLDKINSEDLSSISDKIFDLAAKSNQLEEEIKNK